VPELGNNSTEYSGISGEVLHGLAPGTKPDAAYLLSLSLVRWQISSTEKLKASAKATASHSDCLVTATKVIMRQNRLTITVKAFFSVKYYFIKTKL
jgi:hypothetical protein